jgi:hypothetical protein
MLLIYPAATVQLSIEYVVLEVVDGLAHVERRLTLTFATQSNVVPVLALLEKP